ncbi:uncharacterized protein LOC101158135 isoform X1 [Oryzias latipes]|uniref:uncharacterized protein LOC101158135 isoform X1 n=1 Tax=Oryzias latipes TaxID=8090 RepID=UPI000CE2193B|nr:uncharacterized protein LOC101158135 isoform X1 [Oryzias latipes]
MFKCLICQAVHVTCKSLTIHLRLDHSFYPSTRFKLLCAQGCFRRQFSTYSGFKKHLETVHRDKLQSGNSANLEPFEATSFNDTTEVNSADETLRSEAGCSENSGSSPQKENVKIICTSIIAKLQGSGMANSAVSTIISDMQELTTEMQSQIKVEVLSALPPDNPIRPSLEKTFDKFENPFLSFNTETKRVKYFKNKWGIVEPVDIMLGVRFDNRKNKQTGTYDQVPVKDTFVYIPILETIKFIWRNSEICKLLKHHHFSKTNVLEDFCDGSYFKAHPLFSEKPNSLQILLYYDDFETANPLGSKRTVHKVGALYFVLRNLPAKFNSALMNIHLVALFHTDDVKKYGFDPILQPLINDIKILEHEGLYLPFSTEKVHGTICQITWDNQGMHTILGFTESFNGHYFCRLCLIEKDDAQRIYNEDDFQVTLRERNVFEIHCKQLQSEPQKSSLPSSCVGPLPLLWCSCLVPCPSPCHSKF